ncbi:ABC transporter ATP-binding protein [Variovorax sp. PBL-E5]|uniref:ABC transporter ATP-binding protein n=1 Tax=Variovorax sp. PBL-E5 TaxID=434014 RepID=UPI001316AC69|nr:ABC transporter ATP-binding protein [Variovorax sp. PBL-E5]VTU46025.1 Lipopolysaccharide export system ATP-binding protein LptB [Variovorax sp. PBL-E5]
MSAILELDRASKSFGGIAAVSELSFAAGRGKVTGLMGPNGAGKTTVINLISGLLKCDSGSIRLEGTEVSRAKPHDIGALGLARTYQNVRLISGLTALEQVIAGSFLKRDTSFIASFLHTPAARRRMRALRDKAMHLLQRVGMAHAADTLAETLSYGEQRRVEIARALGADPVLLLLDEPTAGMNPQESNEIGQLTHRLRDEGLSILMVEHNMKLVVDFCDSVVVVNFGRRIAVGKPVDCIRDSKVQEAYFGKQRIDADGLGTLG